MHVWHQLEICFCVIAANVPMHNDYPAHATHAPMHSADIIGAENAFPGQTQ